MSGRHGRAPASGAGRHSRRTDSPRSAGVRAGRRARRETGTDDVYGYESSTGRAGRRERRKLDRERRRSRRRWVTELALLAVLLATLGSASVLAVIVLNQDRNGYGYQASGSEVRTQHTVLLQVRGGDASALASALLANDRVQHQSAMILVPNATATQVPGVGVEPFGKAVAGSGGAALSRSALGDLLGVRVDASWVLDGSTFAQLIDRLGGITADVDADVVVTRGGHPQTLVSKGPDQLLDGGHALAVLGFRRAGESELQALPRARSILQGLLAKLPGGNELADLSNALSKGSELSDLGVVSDLLDGLRGDIVADRLSVSAVPVAPTTISGQSMYRLDIAGVDRMVEQVLAASRLPGSETPGNRVLVLNQLGKPGISQQVRSKIAPAGFTLVDSRSSPRTADSRETVVLIFDGSEAAHARARRLAAALGVPKAPIEVSVRAQNIADLIVLVGSDLAP